MQWIAVCLHIEASLIICTAACSKRFSACSKPCQGALPFLLPFFFSVSKQPGTMLCIAQAKGI
jgi:hypothetical protein